MCGFILGWQSGAYHFDVTFTLTLNSDLIFTFSCLEHNSYITNNFPQMCFMLDQLLWGHFRAFITLLCHVFVLTLKYVSTVEYLSIYKLPIHNLSLSHFSQFELRFYAAALILKYKIGNSEGWFWRL